MAFVVYLLANAMLVAGTAKDVPHGACYLGGMILITLAYGMRGDE